MLYATAQPFAFDNSKYSLVPESAAELGTPSLTTEAWYSKGFTAGVGVEGKDSPWDLSVYYGRRDTQLKLTGANNASFTSAEESSAMSTHVFGVEGGYSFLNDRIPVRLGVWGGPEKQCASSGTYAGTSCEEGTFQASVNNRFDHTDEGYSRQHPRIPMGFDVQAGVNVTDLVAGGSSPVDIEVLWKFSARLLDIHSDQAAKDGGDLVMQDAFYPDRVEAVTINPTGFQMATGPVVRISVRTGDKKVEAPAPEPAPVVAPLQGL